MAWKLEKEAGEWRNREQLSHQHADSKRHHLHEVNTWAKGAPLGKAKPHQVKFSWGHMGFNTLKVEMWRKKNLFEKENLILCLATSHMTLGTRLINSGLWIPHFQFKGTGRRGTCRTLLIHWKLSSSVESGLCSATITILSSCRTVTENTAILCNRDSNEQALVLPGCARTTASA